MNIPRETCLLFLILSAGEVLPTQARRASGGDKRSHSTSSGTSSFRRQRNLPATTVGACADDPQFEFKLENVEKTVTCEWLRQNEEKTAARVDRYCDDTRIKYACPKSCLEDEGLSCECPGDTDGYTFSLDVVGTEQECSWLTRNSAKEEERKLNYCFENQNTEEVSDDVGKNCISSCGFCTGSFWTSAPTLSPSSSPSQCVNEPGWKTHELGFTCDEIDQLKLNGPDFDYCVKFSDAAFEGKSIYEACCLCGGSDFVPVAPSVMPSLSTEPTSSPSTEPSLSPSHDPTDTPSEVPSDDPSSTPSAVPSESPSMSPSKSPSDSPSEVPSDDPSSTPSAVPSESPSMSPSKSPSDSPSGIPSDDPSSSPSVTPAPSLHPSSLPSNAPSPEECSDDADFTFVLDTGAIQNCEWLTKNAEKTADRIDRYCGDGHVKGACQKSCSFCDCMDDPEHTFELVNVEGTQSCSWLTQNENPGVTDQRLDRYCYSDVAQTIASDTVGDYCVFSCGFCKGNYRSPPVPPS